MHRLSALIIRSTLYALSLASFMFACLLVYFAHDTVKPIVVGGMVSVPVIIMILCFLFARMTSKYSDLSGCKREFTDVADFKIPNIVITVVATVIMLVVTLFMNYAGVNAFDTDYAQEQQELIDTYHANNTSIMLGKCLPVWCMQKTLDTVKYVDLAKDTSLQADSTEAAEQAINEAADIMDSKHHDTNIRRVIGIICFLIYGMLFTYVMRWLQYKRRVARLEEK